jgi:hypothetical protein
MIARVTESAASKGEAVVARQETKQRIPRMTSRCQRGQFLCRYQCLDLAVSQLKTYQGVVRVVGRLRNQNDSASLVPLEMLSILQELSASLIAGVYVDSAWNVLDLGLEDSQSHAYLMVLTAAVRWISWGILRLWTGIS